MGDLGLEQSKAIESSSNKVQEVNAIIDPKGHPYREAFAFLEQLPLPVFEEYKAKLKEVAEKNPDLLARQMRLIRKLKGVAQ